MKPKLITLICNLALLGTTATAPAQSTTLLADWSSYTPTDTTFPFAARLDAPLVSSASMDYHGLFGGYYDGAWASTNYATTLNTTTAPYLEWTINFNAGANISNVTFFFGLGELPGITTKVNLRYSIDNYASSLGDFSMYS